MMTFLQRQVLDFLSANPGATTSEIVNAICGDDEHGELAVSVCLTALENRGVITPENRLVVDRRETEKR
jgi:hypothetical protein